MKNELPTILSLFLEALLKTSSLLTPEEVDKFTQNSDRVDWLKTYELMAFVDFEKMEDSSKEIEQYASIVPFVDFIKSI